MDLAHSAVNAFIERAARLKQYVTVFANPTEELIDAHQSGRKVKLFAKGSLVRKPLARLEENYLYFTRRFPSASNNTIGSGALVAGTYPYFGRAVGDDGSGVGFPTGFTLSLQETNMEVAGQVAQGSSFVLNQIGVSVNADATVGDVNQVLDAMTLQFAKTGGTFTINHGPIKFWPGAFGNGGFAAAATTVAATTINVQHGSNGAVDIRAVRNLRIARTLRPNETFIYNLIVNRATKATDGTAFALTNFLGVTLWLWGGQKNAIVG